MMPMGLPSLRTTAEPTPRSIIQMAASWRLSSSSTVSTARVMSGPISMAGDLSQAKPLVKRLVNVNTFTRAVGWQP